MPDSDKNLIRKAYSVATTRLREEHRPHFLKLMAEEAEKLGVKWKPRPTSEEKAKADLQKMLTDNPALAEYVVELIKSQSHEGAPE